MRLARRRGMQFISGEEKKKKEKKKGLHGMFIIPRVKINKSRRMDAK